MTPGGPGSRAAEVARFLTPLGTMRARTGPSGELLSLEFEDPPPPTTEAETPRPGPGPVARQVAEYFARERRVFDLALDPRGTAFELAVWEALLEVPWGETTSYGAIAARLGRPDGSRAVGRAAGANPIAIVVPCHRALGAGGALTGYAGGIERKRALLALEGSLPLELDV